MIEFFISIIGGVISGIIATHLYYKVKQKQENRPLNNLLNFGNDELIFVFSHREHVPQQSVLPRTSTEDFLAMNNIISALLKIGWKTKISVRDTSRLSPADRNHNIVSVCSSKSNSFTKLVLEEYAKRHNNIFHFDKIEDLNQWKISDGVANYPSPSFEQINKYLAQGVNITEQEIDDVALIAKITNPWNAANKILIVAGIRGIGTWGAAECIKKKWEQIYNLKSDKNSYRKDGDFAAVVSVKYNNCDIVDIKVHSLKDFS
jgi:hypothetical protein